SELTRFALFPATCCQDKPGRGATNPKRQRKGPAPRRWVRREAFGVRQSSGAFPPSSGPNPKRQRTNRTPRRCARGEVWTDLRDALPCKFRAKLGLELQ